MSSKVALATVLVDWHSCGVASTVPAPAPTTQNAASTAHFHLPLIGFPFLTWPLRRCEPPPVRLAPRRARHWTLRGLRTRKSRFRRLGCRSSGRTGLLARRGSAHRRQTVSAARRPTASAFRGPEGTSRRGSSACFDARPSRLMLKRQKRLNFARAAYFVSSAKRDSLSQNRDDHP